MHRSVKSALGLRREQSGTDDPPRHPVDTRDVGSGALGLLFIAAVVAVLHTLVGCGSAAQGSLNAQTLPNVATVTVIACDGGTVHFGGDLWLDARSGSATTDSAQQGQHIDSQVEGHATVAASAQGNASAAPAEDPPHEDPPAPTEDPPAPAEGSEPQPGADP